METLWTPLFAFMIFTLCFGLFGDIIARKTKAIISAIIVGCIIYLIGFLTGIIPTTAVDDTGITVVMSNFGIALMITNLGTLINLKDLIREWKTVIISCVGLIGIAIVAFTIGSWLFGRDYALTSAPPLSGAIIATILTTDAANAAGRPDLAAFATLVCAMQMFVGLPLASKALKIEANRFLKENNLSHSSITNQTTSTAKEKPKEWDINFKILKELPQWMQTPGIILFKLSFVAIIATLLSNLTMFGERTTPLLNVNIAYLLCGIIATEIGFLETNALTKANCFGFLMLGTLAILPGNFKSVTWASLSEMIIPLIGMLLLSAIGIIIMSIIAGKIFGYSPAISAACGLTALFGYPCTQIITDEVVESLSINQEEKKRIHQHLLPKMLIAGFTTVTIASVIFSGIIIPMIF